MCAREDFRRCMHRALRISARMCEGAFAHSDSSHSSQFGLQDPGAYRETRTRLHSRALHLGRAPRRCSGAAKAPLRPFAPTACCSSWPTSGPRPSPSRFFCRWGRDAHQSSRGASGRLGLRATQRGRLTSKYLAPRDTVGEVATPRLASSVFGSWGWLWSVTTRSSSDATGSRMIDRLFQYCQSSHPKIT